MILRAGSVFCVILMAFTIAGCDSSTTSSPEATKPPTTEQFVAPGSQVMTEEYRRAVTDEMVRQGADPTEAEAFTRALNEAQSEWEGNR